MKLTIKTLQQSTFKVDAEPEQTVKELKQKIEDEQGKTYPVSSQKLIYSGKVLADESKLEEYQIDEKKFLVLMITRPPPAPKPPAQEKTSVTKKDESAGKPKQPEDKPKPNTQQSTSSATVSTTNSTSTLSSSSTTTTTTTSSPSVTPNTTAARNADANRSLRSSGQVEASSLPMSEPHIASRLAAMMTQPHFRQIQDLIQQSPHLLSSTIEALAGSDPEMYNFISENPDVFVSALNHPPLAGSRTPSTRSNTGGQQQRQSERTSQQAPATRSSTGARQQPVVDQILGDVSEHDKEAIERLKELGFSEYLAIQAYMACDKDEQLAANLLFQMDQ